MSGHSKWANTKHRKGKQDSKRAKIFTKLARAITVATREGGGDPEYNSSLATAIEKAKAENLPNDNIDRAIKNGLGGLNGETFDHITYEAYGPCGTAFMIQCLTNNKNRTAADVRHYFSKFGGNLGTTGCVGYLFDRKGIITIELSDKIDEEELMMQALEFGADDVEVDELYEVITEPENFLTVLNQLKNTGYEVKGEVAFVPQNYVKVEGEENLKNIDKLIDALEDNDDVQEIFHNWEMPEEEE